MNEEEIKKFATQKDWVFVGEGWDNIVYANKQRTTIFRLPKKTDGVDILKMEEQILPLLAEKNLGGTIPVPILIEEDNFSYAQYPYVKGKQYHELSKSKKRDLLNKLGEFLGKLHNLDISFVGKLSKVNCHEKYSFIFENVKQELSQMLSNSQMKYATELFETYVGKKEYAVPNESILHGDISLEHVYYVDGHISIIDWSDLHISDPAREFYHLFRSLSEEERKICMNAYRATDPFFLKRANVYPLLDTFEVLLIFVKKNQEERIKEFLIRVDQDMIDWKLQS